MFVDSFLGEILTPAVVANRPTLHFFLHVFHHSRVFCLVHLIIFTFLQTLEMFLDGSEPPESFLTSVTDVLDVVVDGDTLPAMFPGVQDLPPAVLASLAPAGAVLTPGWSARRSDYPGLEPPGVTALNVRPLCDGVRHQSEELLLAVGALPPLALPVFAHQVGQQVEPGVLAVPTDVAGVGKIGAVLLLVLSHPRLLCEGKLTVDAV